jgi:hypothetical protein
MSSWRVLRRKKKTDIFDAKVGNISLISGGIEVDFLDGNEADWKPDSSV